MDDDDPRIPGKKTEDKHNLPADKE
jgi:hypothetical protein